MILSDGDIIETHLEEGESLIVPFDVARVQPASYELTLGRGAKYFNPIYEEAIMSPTFVPDDMYIQDDDPTGDFIGIGKGEFVLVTTQETVNIPDYLAARVEGKSSLGRLGLMVHVTAGYIDPGFSGQITLELVNLSPIHQMLPIGMKIGQLSFVELTNPAQRPYGSPELGSRYQNQEGVSGSRGVDALNEFYATRRD